MSGDLYKYIEQFYKRTPFGQLKNNDNAHTARVTDILDINNNNSSTVIESDDSSQAQHSLSDFHCDDDENETDIHNTKWKDVNLTRFAALMCLGTTAENLIYYPFFVLKTREQADHGSRFGWSSTKFHVTDILKKQGVTGFYRGFGASTMVSIPAYGAYLGVYVSVKDSLGYHPVHNPVMPTFIAGFLADVASISLYVPGDVVAQRMQVAAAAAGGGAAAGAAAGGAASVSKSVSVSETGLSTAATKVGVDAMKLTTTAGDVSAGSGYSSASESVMTIWRTEGVRGFYRGTGATFVSSALASAVWWTIYEKVKAVLYTKTPTTTTNTKKTPTVVKTTGAAGEQDEDGRLYNDLSNSDSSESNNTKVNRWPQAAAGFTAGTITSALLNPIDVVKTRLQTQQAVIESAPTSPLSTTSSTAASASSSSSSSSSISSSPSPSSSSASSPSLSSSSPRRYRNLLHGLRCLIVDEGVSGCLRGVLPKLASRGMISAVSGALLEMVLYHSVPQEVRDKRKRKEVLLA